MNLSLEGVKQSVDIFSSVKDFVPSHRVIKLYGQ